MHYRHYNNGRGHTSWTVGYVKDQDLGYAALTCYIARCSPKDQFSRKKGRKLVEDAGLSILRELTFHYNEGVSLDENILACIQHAVATDCGAYDQRHLVELRDQLTKDTFLTQWKAIHRV